MIGSSPVVGSSKNRISGLAAIARASATRFCIPPDSSAGHRSPTLPASPTDEKILREWVTRDVKRSAYPVGVARQMAAIVSNGDRREKLKGIRVPAVVLHGDADPLVPVDGGRDTAASIPGAELRIVPGMGHDFPIALVGTFADAITAATTRAAASKAAE